jgi:hypothetical protein
VSPVTTDRVLPPVSLGRDPSPRPAPGPHAAARPAGGRAPIVAATAPSHRQPWRRDRLGVRIRRESERPTGIAPAARLAKPRGDALLSTATRTGVLIGVSAAVYAVSLASVSGLQAQSQSDAAAAAQPALDALASAKASNDEIAAAIKAADTRLQTLASDYNTTSGDMAAYQAQFAQLSALVAKIQGSAAAMNANFKLPTVTMRGAIGSGGGGGGTVVVTTSASGKP